LLEEKDQVKTGDELYLQITFREVGRIVKVERISPGGRITLENGETYKKDGRKIEGGHFSRSELYPLTSERRETIEHHKNVSYLREIDWREISPEKCKAIRTILEQ
jgi:hypothetical protein